jgi:hypothetical protein
LFTIAETGNSIRNFAEYLQEKRESASSEEGGTFILQDWNTN